MHLALIISSLGAGGAERVLSDLANHWTAQGHKISLITFASPDTPPFYFLDPSITLIQLNQCQTKRFFLSRVKDIIKRIFILRKTISQLKLDAVLSFIDITNLTTLLATRGLGIPVVVTERTNPYFHKIPKAYDWLRSFLYRFSARLVVQTQNAASYFKPQLEAHLQIIPNVVHKPFRCMDTLNQHPQHLISVGRLEVSKDYATLIHAFSRILHYHPSLTLTIYGEGRERRSLETLIQTLGLQDNVSLPGNTYDIQTELLKADIFIFPSHYEGFPNALCEAMAVGLPVIASSCSGNVDIVTDGVNGRLFPIGDTEALTHVTLELLHDLPQRQRLSENGKTLPDQFSQAKIYALWDEIIQTTAELKKKSTKKNDVL